MLTDHSREKLVPCPDHVAVIGGGRWARVLTDVLCGFVPRSAALSIHSLHHAELMSAWMKKQRLDERVEVSSKWPQFSATKSNAVIVVNAAQDHEQAVEWALSVNTPVLVEKPIAMTAAAAKRLADSARSRNVRFAAAHVFLFARYLDCFSKRVKEERIIRSLRMVWTDPRSEHRYGELKRYDANLPIYADWLPHILSMLDALTPWPPEKYEVNKYLKNGDLLELRFHFGDIPCNIHLERNSDHRRRILEVITESRSLQLDFSSEPGIITDGSISLIGDPDWETQPRPVRKMLTAFLVWAAGGEYDKRLNPETGLRTCEAIDQIARLIRKP